MNAAPVGGPIFQAQWPAGVSRRSSLERIAKAFYSFTPIGIVHNILFWCARFFIHPASAMHLADHNWRERLLSRGGRVVTFKTPDGETLEGLLFKSRVGSGKGVVCALGNGYCCDHAVDQVDFFREHVPDADLLVVNYRGVGRSTGASSPDGLSLDVYTACEYLRQEHKVFRQTVYGHSLGGYAAVKGGALFQKAHPDEKVSLISDRSFSSLSAAVTQIAGRALSFLAILIGWELDATSDLSLFEGRRIVIYNRGDGVIPFGASFFRVVQNLPNVYGVELDCGGKLPSFEQHNRPFSPREAKEIAREVFRRQPIAV